MDKKTTLCWQCQAEMKKVYNVEILRDLHPDKTCSQCGKKKGVYALDVVRITNKEKGE